MSAVEFFDAPPSEARVAESEVRLLRRQAQLTAAQNSDSLQVETERAAAARFRTMPPNSDFESLLAPAQRVRLRPGHLMTLHAGTPQGHGTQTQRSSRCSSCVPCSARIRVSVTVSPALLVVLSLVSATVG